MCIKNSAIRTGIALAIGLDALSVGGYAFADPPSGITETRVFAEPACDLVAAGPVKRQESAVAGVAAALAQTLVQAGVGFATSLLNNLGDANTVSASGTTGINFYTYDTKGKILRLNPSWACIVVVRGTFGLQGTADKANFDSSWQSDPYFAFADNHHLVKTPEMVFEAITEASPDQGKFQIKPVFFEVNKNLDWSLLTGYRDFVFTFTFDDPATADPSKSGFAAATLTFSNILHPIRFEREMFESGKHATGKTSGWLNIPALLVNSKADVDAWTTFQTDKQSAKDLDDQYKDADQQQLGLLTAQLAWKDNVADQKKIYDLKLKIAKAKNDALLAGKFNDKSDQSIAIAAATDSLEPVNLTVQFTETREANKYVQAFAKALNDSISANKDTLNSSITNAVTGQAASDARDNAVTLQQAALTSYSAYLDKLDAFNTATGDIPRKKAYADLQSAQIDYANKAQKARATPGGSVVPVDPILPPAP